MSKRSFEDVFDGSEVRMTIKELVLGGKKDPRDPNSFHAMSLIAFMAWVGLGADGLSSSAYGPDEAFRQLGAHTGLAAFIAVAMVITVLVISGGYSRIIEKFPSGGGGYLVATKLLGARAGVVSGSALLVDYVLTISVSIASGADAVFSFLPVSWVGYKLVVEVVVLVGLTILNMRGVKESVTVLLPFFLAFLVSHAVLLACAIGGHVGDMHATYTHVTTSVHNSVHSLGLIVAIKLAVRAYSLGGGTYTGIEAVSNGLGIMREPRIQTAKRTMLLMAASLAIVAGGILISYLLVGAVPHEGMTMNAVLLDRVFGSWHVAGLPVGHWFAIFSLITEAVLLLVAAEAGFVDGPRVMANMAIDSWLPHRFAALSERLTMQNGVLLMGASGLATLIYTHGDVGKLVVMYSINVFATFTLSNLGMTRYWLGEGRKEPGALRSLALNGLAVVLCATILAITVSEKFFDGGWLTVVVTAALVATCYLIKGHYARVAKAIAQLDADLPPDMIKEPPVDGEVPTDAPIAVFFVGGFNGLGRHAVLSLLRRFPDYFKGFIFVSIAVVDSGAFKGVGEVEALQEKARADLARYVEFARRLGLPAASECHVGTEVPEVAEEVACSILQRHARAIFVSGKLVFAEEDSILTAPLHNLTAYAILRRLHRLGMTMEILPVRVALGEHVEVPALLPRTLVASVDASPRST